MTKNREVCSIMMERSYEVLVFFLNKCVLYKYILCTGCSDPAACMPGEEAGADVWGWPGRGSAWCEGHGAGDAHQTLHCHLQPHCELPTSLDTVLSLICAHFTQCFFLKWILHTIGDNKNRSWFWAFFSLVHSDCKHIPIGYSSVSYNINLSNSGHFVCSSQDEEGRCYSDSFQELPALMEEEAVTPNPADTQSNKPRWALPTIHKCPQLSLSFAGNL